MRFLIAGLVLTVPFGALLGQNPGQKIGLDVQIAAISLSADTAGIAYVVTNLPSSVEPLWRFFVDAPTGILRIAASTGSFRWRTDTSFRDQSMARWILTGYLPPGSTSPELHFEAVGIPGIITYRAGGHFQLPSRADEPEPDTASLPNPLVVSMITGKTVGVEPWPADRSAQALLARLGTLTQSSCSTPLLWITDAGICSELLSDVNQAEFYRSSGQTMLARTTLLHYQALLSGGRITGSVNSSAYWLLKVNSDIVYGLM